jgi:hypothetical protein
VFAAQSFTTALGSIRFDDNHELADNQYELTACKGKDFVPVVSGSVSKAQ